MHVSQKLKINLGVEASRHVEKTGRVPTAGDVKMMYYTKSGPGPQSLGSEEAIIDPETGLNTYLSKKRKI